MLLSPLFLRLSRRASASQTILSYVEQHNEKKNTPTMAGIVFIISAVAVTSAFGGFNTSLSRMLMLIFLGYGTIGFLDDFIKVKLKQNLGLRAYQKIIAQIAIAGIASYYCATNRFIGTAVRLPFTGGEWHMNIWIYIPFAMLVFIAMSNSVNLTDGLDGLAGSVNVIYFSCFTAIIVGAIASANVSGNVLYEAELRNMAVFSTALIGALIAFLWFNSHKAKYFMGDTGAMALGGACAGIALFLKNPLISALVGIMFAVSSISVIVQVVYFKLTKKRVFLMSPFHHHLELKGVNESKIVAYYSIVSIIACVVALTVS